MAYAKNTMANSGGACVHETVVRKNLNVKASALDISHKSPAAKAHG